MNLLGLMILFMDLVGDYSIWKFDFLLLEKKDRMSAKVLEDNDNDEKS